MAKLYFKYGAMGSSKTAQALITKFNYEERGMDVWLLKPSVDCRDGETLLRSRIGLEATADVVRPEDDIRALYAARGHHAAFLSWPTPSPRSKPSASAAQRPRSTPASTARVTSSPRARRCSSAGTIPISPCATPVGASASRASAPNGRRKRSSKTYT